MFCCSVHHLQSRGVRADSKVMHDDLFDCGPVRRRPAPSASPSRRRRSASPAAAPGSVRSARCRPRTSPIRRSDRPALACCGKVSAPAPCSICCWPERPSRNGGRSASSTVTARPPCIPASQALAARGVRSKADACIALGNLLASPDVPAAHDRGLMKRPPAKARRATDAGLEAGLAAGGETGDEHAAGLHVAEIPMTGRWSICALTGTTNRLPSCGASGISMPRNAQPMNRARARQATAPSF